MSTKLKTIVLTVLLAVFVHFFALAQNIDIRFLTAKYRDGRASPCLDIVFLISTPDSINFPPNIKLPPLCLVFENGREMHLALLPATLQVGIFGNDVANKSTLVFNLVKDLVDVKTLHQKKSFLICYTIKNLNRVFKKMSLSPAFSLKQEPEMMVEKKCVFDIH